MTALGRDLVTEWVRVGGEPRVPAGRRAEAIATLTACMVSLTLYEAYWEALSEVWTVHGSQPPLADYVERDLPERQIFRDGFATLDDVTLADIAVCPSAVYGLYRALSTPPATLDDYIEPGQWYFDALNEADPPLPPRQLLPTTTEAVAPSERSFPSVQADRSRRGQWVHYLPTMVAACLLIAAGLAWVASRNPGNQTNSREVLLASAAQTKSEPRGVNDLVFSLEVSAEREGFVSVIILPIGKAATVHPDYGLDETRVVPGQPKTVGPFEAPMGSVVITVVTETPSTDVVRRVVDGLPAGPTTTDVLTPLVREKLFASGYRWAALGVTNIAASKPAF